MRRYLLACAIALGACSPSPSGIWVRVAEAGCSAVAELVDDSDTVQRLCLVTIDLVRLLSELRAAESSGRPAVVHAVDGAGQPATITVPHRHLAAAAESVRAAMAAR